MKNGLDRSMFSQFKYIWFFCKRNVTSKVWVIDLHGHFVLRGHRCIEQTDKASVLSQEDLMSSSHVYVVWMPTGLNNNKKSC